jgi:hypothetical protein
MKTIAAPLVLVASLALLLGSCVSTRSALVDDLPPGSAKAYVCFRTGLYDDEFGLEISEIEDGVEAPALRTSDAWSGIGDFRVAVAPGKSEFRVRSGNYDQRFALDLRAGELRFIGFRMQYIQSSSETHGTMTTYSSSWYVRGSLGMHAFPAAGPIDLAACVDALGDGDWATRDYALRQIAALKPRLDGADEASIRLVAAEDPVAALRSRAASLLKALGRPAPEKPLFFESFENNTDNRWPNYDDASSGISWYFDPEGYRIASVNGNDHWVTVDFPAKLGERDLDIALDCSWKEGATNVAYGLVIGQDKGNFHAFCVNKNGSAMAITEGPGGWKGKGIEWSAAAAPSIAEREVSRILVRKRGFAYEMSVNGTPIGSFVDEGKLPFAGIGLLVSGKQAVTFGRLFAGPPLD